MQIFFQENDKNSDEVFHEIDEKCAGLIYISETDAPVIAFAGEKAKALTPNVILQQTGLSPDSAIEERDFVEFFDRLTSHKDWHGEIETERAKKFLALKKVLEENLRDLKVFRVGVIRIDIFAVGIDKNGYVIGVSTKAVET